MTKIKRVFVFMMAVMLVFNIYVPKAKAFAAEAAAVGVGMQILQWLGITVAGSAVAWGTTEALEAIFGDPVPANQPAQNYYTAPVNPISRPTIYNPQQVNTTNTTNHTYNTKIVNTVNKTINTYNNTTNNYEVKNYETINYNTENNMYYTKIENKEYFITYAPTYTNITYIDSAANSANDAYSYNLYYQLPDGRNSYDLDADDIWGTVFLNDFVNYSYVPEDDGQTVALYHFDGNIQDDSAKNGSASYLTGASYTYVNSNGFDRALYWDNSNHELQINLPETLGTQDITLEMRIYNAMTTMKTFSLGTLKMLTMTNVVVNGVAQPNNNIYYAAQPPATNNITDFYCLNAANGTYFYNEMKFDDTVQYKNGTTPVTQYNWCFMQSYLGTNKAAFYKVPFLFSSNNVDLFKLAYRSDFTTSLDSGSISNKAYDTVGFATGFGGTTIPTVYPLSIGQWATFTYVCKGGVGKIYYNGIKVVDNLTPLNITNKLSLKLGSGIFDYMYLDELRIAKGALYDANYTPSPMPYDTNLVYVLPTSPVEDRIAIKSNITVTKNRIGGVRPTYPTRGYVYVSLDAANKVDSVQQYNGSEWVDTDGAIYHGAKWNNLDKFDMTPFIASEDDYPDYNDANIIGKNNIVYMLNNVKSTNAVQSVADGETYSVTLAAETGYTIPTSVQVVMGLQELQNGVGYTYTDGVITVPNVTGDLYISATGEPDGTATYSISYSLTNMSLSNQQYTDTGFTASFGVAEKFKLPTNIKVMMGNAELSPITGYTYADGTLTVPIVSDGVLVVAGATVDQTAVNPTPTPTPTPGGGTGGTGTDLTGIISFITGLFTSIVNGISAIVGSIGTLLQSFQGIGTGFTSFLASSFAFIPPEIISLLTLGIGVMIVLAIIKFIRG